MKQIVAAIALVVGITGGLSFALQPIAGAVSCSGAKNCLNSGVSDVNSGSSTDLTGLIKKVINILLFLTGAVAVIMIIIGGIRYVTSGGEQAQITGAKNTILYAVVGLVVASMAFAVVNFVVDKI